MSHANCELRQICRRSAADSTAGPDFLNVNSSPFDPDRVSILA